MAGDSTSLAGGFSMLSDQGAPDSDNSCVTKVHEEQKKLDTVWLTNEHESQISFLADITRKKISCKCLESPQAVHLSHHIDLHLLFRW